MKKKLSKSKKVSIVRKKRPVKLQTGKISRGMIIGIGIAVLAIGGGGYYFLNQSAGTPSPLAGIVKAPLNPSCDKNDPELCKFLNNWQAQKSYSITSIAKDKDGQTMESLMEISGNKSHMVAKMGGKESYEMITIDKTTYSKDYTDNKWWKTTYDPEKDITKDIVDTDKFVDTSIDTEVVDKTEYKAMGTEQCGDMNCFKYQVVNPEDTTYTEFIWFDDKDYLLRKQTSTDSEGTVNEITYSYGAISISEPSPVKEGTPEAMYGMPEMSAEDKAAYEQMMKEYETSSEIPVEETSASEY